MIDSITTQNDFIWLFLIVNFTVNILLISSYIKNIRSIYKFDRANAYIFKGEPSLGITLSGCSLLFSVIILLTYFYNAPLNALAFCAVLSSVFTILSLILISYRLRHLPEDDFILYSLLFKTYELYYSDCIEVREGKIFTTLLFKNKKIFISKSIPGYHKFIEIINNHSVQVIKYKPPKKEITEAVTVIKATKLFKVFSVAAFIMFAALSGVSAFSVISGEGSDFEILLMGACSLLSLALSIFYLCVLVEKITVYNDEGYFIYKSLLKTYEVNFSDCLYYKWDLNGDGLNAVFCVATKEKKYYIPSMSSDKSSEKFRQILVKNKIKRH